MLTLLTATGCRPEAFALTERMMARQTYTGPVRWIIVDDGEQAQPVTFSRPGWMLEVLRPEPFWKPGDNTQGRNLLVGLNAVDKDARLVIIEDDDWYASDWLEVCNTYLDRASLVGETKARYYNVAQRVGRQLNNVGHSSLCSTAMRGEAINVFRRACQVKQQFIDIDLWRRHRDALLFPGNRVVGIKGMPGRGGIGMGHKQGFNGQRDPMGTLLREWVGSDAEWYFGRA
jgi:hypothetical protein